MVAEILDGKLTSQKLLEKLQTKVANLAKKPILAILLVGENPASMIYVNAKLKKAKDIGFETVFTQLKNTATEQDVLEQIEKWNNDTNINGILVQLPLPEHINKNTILNAISPKKDVDGFHEINVGKLMIGEDTFVPCTTAGIVELLKENNIDIEGKHCVVVGRSNIVGKYILLFRNKDDYF